MRSTVTLALALLLFACESSSPSGPSAAATPAGLPDGDPALACKKVQEGGLLVDVRTPKEFRDGHAEGAINIPVSRLAEQLERIEELTGGDKSKPVVVYCQSGRRAGRAKQQLLAAGYTQVSNLGGLADWPDCPSG